MKKAACLLLALVHGVVSIPARGAAFVPGGRLRSAGTNWSAQHGRRQRQTTLQMSWLDILFPPKKPAKTEKREVVVVGGGVSGLICAKKLQAQGKDVVLLEQSDGVGGRVRTDEYKGFLLDRGFQVFIEGYPQLRDNLDYKALDLQSFCPGALVRADGGFYTVADPFRRPQDSIKGLIAPVGSLADKLRVAALRVQATQRSVAAIFNETEVDTETYLTKRKGFGPQMVDRFFRPFYQGIYLAPLSEQSSRMFEFVFKMFAERGISLPKAGIGAVSNQLASQLKPGTVLTSTAVKRVTPGRVELKNGDVYNASAVVVATEEPSARLLLGSRLAAASAKPVKGRGSTCLYYAINGSAPIKEPLLILNGEGTDEEKRPVNNVVFLSNINKAYAPPGQTLVSVTVVGVPKAANPKLDQVVRQQLMEWFGTDVRSWELLRIYRIPYAQPLQTPPNGESFIKSASLGDGVFVCGDYRNTATINGAFESGELAAEAVLSYLSSIKKEAKAPPAAAVVPATASAAATAFEPPEAVPVAVSATAASESAHTAPMEASSAP